MELIISFLAALVLAAVHVTVSHWRWLYRGEHSAWLSVSAGSAVAYVFAYLLPKLQLTQERLDQIIASTGWQPLVSNQVYLIGLAGLVSFYWLAWVDESVAHDGSPATGSRGHRLVLHIGGYGAYSIQMGFLLGSNSDASLLAHLITVVVLGLHLMGVDHGIRRAYPADFDRFLRWVFAGALILGWGLGAMTDLLATFVMLWTAFIGGGIVITALRDELPGHSAKRFSPFLFGVIGATLAILVVQMLQQ